MDTQNTKHKTQNTKHKTQNTKQYQLNIISPLAQQAKGDLLVDISALPSHAISTDYLACYHRNYRALSGQKLPGEVVNRVIREVISPRHVRANHSIRMALFAEIATQIRAMQIKSSREIWRLTNVYTQLEYGFTISYLSWFIYKFTTLTKSFLYK